MNIMSQLSERFGNSCFKINGYYRLGAILFICLFSKCCKFSSIRVMLFKSNAGNTVTGDVVFCSFLIFFTF